MKAFLAGLGVGAAVAFLIAPQEGTKTRATLVKSFTNLFVMFRHGRGQVVASSESESEAVAEVLNTANKHYLMSVDGIGKGTAKRIIKNRPYETVEEVVQEGILPEQIVDRVKEQLIDKSTT